MVPESPPIPERGLLTLSDAAWAQAVLRSQMIAPLARCPSAGPTLSQSVWLLKLRALRF